MNRNKIYINNINYNNKTNKEINKIKNNKTSNIGFH